MVAFCASFPHENGGRAGWGCRRSEIAPIPTFLAGRTFPCMGMPFGKRGVYAAKPLPHPRCRGKEWICDCEIEAH